MSLQPALLITNASVGKAQNVLVVSTNADRAYVCLCAVSVLSEPRLARVNPLSLSLSPNQHLADCETYGKATDQLAWTVGKELPDTRDQAPCPPQLTNLIQRSVPW